MKIKVITVQDGKHWFTQGVDVDYGTQGGSPEEALGNFALGLRSTIALQKERIGRVSILDECTPGELLAELRAEHGSESEVEI